MPRRRLVRLALVAACVLALTGCTLWKDLEQHEEQEDAARSFYVAPDPLQAGEPGELIDTMPITTAPDGARAWRVMYHSTDLTGADIAVTGTVLVPSGDAPDGGWPVIAWGHPTTGVAPECGPANGFFPLALIEGMGDLLDDGFAIAAADYPGLGIANASSYLLGVPEGRSVLDSVRAARALPDVELSADVYFWGHSQGGQAALFAAQLAPSYAPELTPVTVAVAAPAADLATLLADDIDDVSGVTIGSYAFSAYQEAYAASTPGLSLDQILTPEAIAAIPQMEKLCLLTQNAALHDIAGPLVGGFLVADPSTTEPWAGFLAENTPGATPFGVPVLIVQGGSDELVRPTATLDFANGMCAAGQQVAYASYPTATHGTIVIQSLPDVRDWLRAARDGSTPSTCAF